MLLNLILLFTLLPFLELYLLLAVAGTLGVFETLMICLLTGVAGGYLARREGLAVWNQVREQIGQGRPPAGPLLEAFLVFAGGLLLLTPGIATDLLGFSMVFPLTRRALAGEIARRIQHGLSNGAMQFHVIGGGMPGMGMQPPGGPEPSSPTDTGHPNLRRLP
jgi:UPF0716 protein FxsA